MTDNSWIVLAFYVLLVTVLVGGIVLSAIGATLQVDLGLLGFMLGSFWFLVVLIVGAIIFVLILIMKVKGEG